MEEGDMVGLLWAVTVILVLAWLLGFAVNLGAWIHVLLVLALVALVFNLLTGAIGRRTY
jgi:hypothetical protein